MAWTNLQNIHYSEKMLWACVLRRTIFDYVLYKGVGKHKLRWQQAFSFIFLDEPCEDGLDFEQICSLFGWEPDYIRRMTKNLDRTDIKRLEPEKMKEFFGEEPAAVFSESLHWATGQSVPIFIPCNYSEQIRRHMGLRVVWSRPEEPKRLKSFVPKVRWSLAG